MLVEGLAAVAYVARRCCARTLARALGMKELRMEGDEAALTPRRSAATSLRMLMCCEEQAR